MKILGADGLLVRLRDSMKKKLAGDKMVERKCFYRNRVADSVRSEPEDFVLPSPIPHWPQGSGFGTALITIGELEVFHATRFEFIWGCNGKQGVSFYKPIGLPDGFFSLGHYCQHNEKPLRGFVLVARAENKVDSHDTNSHFDHMPAGPALLNPVDYSLIWISGDGDNPSSDGCGYFWLPQQPTGYKTLGFVVTSKPEKPDLDEVKCVRADLTDTCISHRLIVKFDSKSSKAQFTVFSTRPLHRGVYGRGVAVGTFYCSSHLSLGEELNVACLKNLDHNLHAMPDKKQIDALIRHYGPHVLFHPDEVYLPSSVSWFFRNGALLHSENNPKGIAIDSEGSNLPSGGTNDRMYWIGLPCDDGKENVKHGNMESAKLYVHVKPALGGTFTDIVMWVFCPFNGPATLKLGMMNFSLGKVGQHVGDWEHFTLRISNFTGELWSIYFSQHSGGEWVDIFDLEFIEGNRAIVYSSKGGHACFPHPGTHLQGSTKLAVGLRNDAAASDYCIDSSKQYEIIAAEYLGDEVVNEPSWLQYMREWGPIIVYNSRTELDKILRVFPAKFRCSVESICNKLPLELYGEEGPTGPKEKNNWFGDERC